MAQNTGTSFKYIWVLWDLVEMFEIDPTKIDVYMEHRYIHSTT